VCLLQKEIQQGVSRVSLHKVRSDGVNKQEENWKNMNSKAVRKLTNIIKVHKYKYIRGYTYSLPQLATVFQMVFTAL
jgi:hypothetical protein